MAGLTSSCHRTEPPNPIFFTPFLLIELNCLSLLIAYCLKYMFYMSPRVSGMFK